MSFAKPRELVKAAKPANNAVNGGLTVPPRSGMGPSAPSAAKSHSASKPSARVATLSKGTPPPSSRVVTLSKGSPSTARASGGRPRPTASPAAVKPKRALLTQSVTKDSLIRSTATKATPPRPVARPRQAVSTAVGKAKRSDVASSVPSKLAASISADAAPSSGPTALSGLTPEQVCAEEWSDRYWQAKLLELTALDKTKKKSYALEKEVRLSCCCCLPMIKVQLCSIMDDEISLQCALLWAAHSRQRNSLTSSQIKLDSVNYLRQFISEKIESNAALKQLSQTLPNAAAMLSKLATALDESQNYVKVEGTSKIEEPLASASRWREVLEEEGKAMKEVIQNMDPACTKAADIVSDLLQAATEAGESRMRCLTLVAEAVDQAAKEKSMLATTNPVALDISSLTLDIPPPVPPPKLIDF
jgi:hypothetical protein